MTSCAVDDHEIESAVTPAPAPAIQDWPQPFGTADHAGAPRGALAGMRIAAAVIQDEDAAAEIESNGFLQVHEGSPLLSGDWLLVPAKRGFTDAFHQSTVRHRIDAYRISRLVALPPGAPTPTPDWTYASSFQTFDAAVGPFFDTNGYVQAFNVAVGGKFVYVPGVHGTIDQVALASGQRIATIDPFVGTPLDGDARLIAVAGPTVLPDGSAVYPATAFGTSADPLNEQPRGSWLIRVMPTGAFSIRDWSPDNAIKIAGGGIVALPNIPRVNDLCEWPFGTRGTPKATGPDSHPPMFGCGAQRPAMNAPVAYRDGVIAAVSYANNARGVGYVVRINPTTFAPLNAASIRDNHLLYGCGRRLSISFPGCDVLTVHGATNLGVDPAFNGTQRPHTPLDIMSAAAMIGADGSTHWSWYDDNFVFDDPGTYDSRGSAGAWHADATFLASNSEFGFDVTDAISADGSLVQDRNLYNEGDLGAARYSPTFQLRSIGRVESGLFLDAVDKNVITDDANSFYVMAESGVYWKFSARGEPLETLQLTPEPVSVVSVYQAANSQYHAVSYGGTVYVIGSGAGTTSLIAGRTSAALVRGQEAKRAALSAVRAPGPSIAAVATPTASTPATVSIPPALQLADPRTICAGGPCQFGAFGNALCTVQCGASAICASVMRGCAVGVDGALTPECGGSGFGICVVQSQPL